MSQDNQKRMEKLLAGLMNGPQAFVHNIDWNNGTALVIEADQAFFSKAVFLDARVLQDVKVGAHIPMGLLLPEIDKVKPPLPPCNFIFHCGHAGSTLVSRLLDEIPGVFGLREPLLLRAMARRLVEVRVGRLPEGRQGFELSLQRVYKLLSRRFVFDQTVVIKATSICNNLATDLLGFHPENRAIGLYVGLETMLANMVMKEEVTDLSGFVQFRLAGLKVHFPNLEVDLENLTTAELVTLSWVAEIYEMFLTSSGPESEKITFYNFDKFLKNPGKGIANVLSGLSLDHDRKTIKELKKSEVFSSYAKQPGFEYGPSDRAVNLKESRRQNWQDISNGLVFANNLVKQIPCLQKAMKKFKS